MPCFVLLDKTQCFVFNILWTGDISGYIAMPIPHKAESQVIKRLRLNNLYECTLIETISLLLKYKFV